MLIETRSENWTKGLQLGNSTQPGFQSLSLLGAKPTGDGVWEAGQGGIYTANRVMLLPFAQGNAGANFSMRVYGWRGLERPSRNLEQQDVWIPCLLAELACTTSTLTAPVAGTGAVAETLLLDTEYLCDTITLTQGGMGWMGEIVSTGPGTDLVAYALIDLRGCRFFSFDFQQVDPVGMNVLFAKA